MGILGFLCEFNIDVCEFFPNERAEDTCPSFDLNLLRVSPAENQEGAYLSRDLDKDEISILNSKSQRIRVYSNFAMFAISDLTTEKFRDTLKTIVRIFESSRSLPKMQTWKNDTITKIFKWADIMSELVIRPSEEKQLLIVEAFKDKLISLDLCGQAENLFHPSLKPVHVTFWVLMTSPFLEFCREPHSIINEALNQTTTKLGFKDL